jgi:predicted nucleic acid-binding protein
MSPVPIGEEVARTAAALAREHGRAHRGIDDADYLIAATALLLDAELLTTNVRHFPDARRAHPGLVTALLSHPALEI